jgi:hypothetical protein
MQAYSPRQVALSLWLTTLKMETNKPLDGRQTENTQERTADAQSHFWTLPEEAQAFDFDEREWESILASFTLPV